MFWTVTGTFVAIVAAVLALAYGFAGGKMPAVERLTGLWHNPQDESRLAFKQKQKERAQKVLSDVGKMLPPSPQKVSSTQRMLMRAGYRNPEAVTMLQGAKFITPIVLICLAYFTGFYKYNPFFILAVAAIGGFLAPDFWLTTRIHKRQHILRLSLPDALDLLVICVEAGLGLDQALMRVSQELKVVHPELSEELELVNSEIRVGKIRIDALRELATRTGVDDIKALIATLIQTDRFGTSVGQSLRVHSDELRTKRRQRAEEAAAKTTVKMVPPLVFFIFPALFVVILGPAAITIMRTFLPIVHH
jgi:tight adherence protein C